MAMARQEDCPVMLSAAKHLTPSRQILRFAQDDNWGQQHKGQHYFAERITVMLSAAKHLVRHSTETLR